MRFSYFLLGLATLILTRLLSQQIQPPQNPLKGQLMFEQKGCVECHAIGGYSGTD